MNKQKKFNQQNSKPILEELEERRLFSGGIEGLIVSDFDSEAQAIYADLDTSKTQTDSTQNQTSVSAAEEQTQEIVFVDEGVDNYQQLVDDIRNNADSSRNIEVVVLDRDQDGIEEISEFLQDRDDLDAIHIISHGSDGSVELGNTSLNSTTLEENNLKVALWANAFAETGDILIYGCNLAETEAGQSLINDISNLTLADVAASTDLTGHISLGGDWDLEHVAGSVEADVAVSEEVQQQWSAVLAATADDSMDYPVGALAGSGGGNGWAGNWSAGSSMQVVASGLTHPTGGLDASGGAVELNAPPFTIPGMQDRDLASPLGTVDETIWASFLLQPDETSDPDNSYMGLAFGTGGLANTNQLFVGYSGTDFKLNSWGGSGTNIEVPGVVSGETVFLVVKIDILASGNETATLYVNPTAGLGNPDVAGSATKTDLDLGTFSTVSIAGARAGAANLSLLDQIRIGSSFTDVAPTLTNVAPTASDNTVSTNEDTDYIFSPADFNFTDANAGDSLQNVQITSLPVNGILRLSGSDVNLNQIVNAGDISAGNLTFTPLADESGTGYDTFEFKVSDGVTVGASGTVLNSFAAPAINSMSGIAFDGTNIWLAGQNADTIYELDTAGNVLSSFAAPGTSPTGITFDGTNLWVISRDLDTVYEIDTAGNVLSSFATPGTDSRGLTWDGTNLWLVEGNGSLIYELTTTGGVVSSFGWPSDYMRDITWDGSSLWVSDQNDQVIRELNTSGTELSSFAAPSTGAAGLAFDGNELWHADADTDTIYQLASTTSVAYSAAAYTMTIDVTAVDDPATITGDISFSGNEGDAVAGDLNATDVDGLADGTYFSVTTQAASGTASIDATTGAWTFTPTAPNWFGSDSFTVTVTDDLGGTTTQVVNITLASVNTPVTAVADSYSVSENATLDSDTGWFDTNWQYSRTLSFDNSTRSENLVDFPVLVKLDSSVIDYAKTHDQGDDLRFFDQDGSALAHEIELWDESGTSYVWVKIPQIDASSGVDSIVMYYGNAGVTGNGQDPAGVWSDYQATYHLNESPGATGTVADAAGNFDATNASSTDTAGFIGNAQDFNGVDQHIDLGDDRAWINNASGATLSIWMNADTTSGSGDLIGLSRNDPADTGASRITLIRNGDDIQMIARTMDDSSDTVSVSTSSNPLSAGTWHHITGTIDYASDTNNIRVYVDGQLEGTFSHNFTLDAIPNTDSSHATIGSDEDGVDSPFDGQLDEARIADQVRSADWISAQHAAMTGNLVTVGFEQTVNGVLINDIDEDRDVLTVTELNGVPAAIGVATALPSGALVTLNADGSFFYDTNSAFESLGAGDSTNDSFTYLVDDGNGATDTATVTITVNGVDDAASITGDTGFSGNEGDAVAGDLDATDVEGLTDGTYFSVTSAATSGTAAINPATGAWTFTPTDPNWFGSDSFTVTVTDDLGGTTEQIINVTLASVNDAPIIMSDGGGANAAINVVENSTVVTTVAANDVDLDTPTYTITGGADQGLFDIDLDSGLLTFDIAPDFEGPGDNVYEVEITAADGNGGFDIQTITVTVTNVADGIIRVTPVSLAPIGGETQVNTTTTDAQSITPGVSQAMATDANGNYIVVWQSNLQDTSGTGIYAQLYNADGSPQGGEFRVNATTADNQSTASVAMDDAGNFVITWNSNLQAGDDDSYGVFAQAFNAAGVAQGSEFQVNTYVTGYQGSPGIAMAANGDFVIQWTSAGQDPDGSYGIYAQRYNAAGVAQDGEFRVNTYTTNYQQVSSMSMDDAGNFVITWGSLGQDGSNYGVFGQVFNADGSLRGSEFQVNATTNLSQLYNDVVMLPDGRFVVAYQSSNPDTSADLFIQAFNADGSKHGVEIQVNAVSEMDYFPIPSITADESGNFTVVWNNSNDGTLSGVFMRSYDWDGNALTGEVQVNTTTAGDQLYPEIVAQPGGGFIIAWSGNGPGDTDGIFTQRFGYQTQEAGAGTAFQLVLETAPTADVVIPVSVSDGSEGSVSAGSITFNSGNWNIPQMVTVSAIQDFILDGTQVYTINIGPATSTDPEFNGFDPADLTITNLEAANTPPQITSDGGGATAGISVAENTTVVTTVAASDINLDTPTYAITGGADQGLFNLDLNSGLLTFDTPPNFEGPGDNSYQVEVTADDGNGGTDVQLITVTVTNLDPIANGAWFDETNSGSGYTDFATMASAHDAYLGTTEQTIDLESLTPGDILSNQFAVSHGVTFSNTGINESQVYAEGGAWIENLTGYDGSYAADGSNIYLKMANDDAATPFTIEFDTPVAKVGALLGMGKEGTEHSVTVMLYDSGGNLIDQQTLDAELWDVSSADQNYETFFGVNYDTAVISKIEILNASNVNYANALIFDQLEWSHTPDVHDTYNASTAVATITGNVLANDIDPAGGSVSVSVHTQPANGSAVYNNDGTFTYTSDVSFTGTDTFTYTIIDGQGGSDTATVTMQVSNAAPTITSDGGGPTAAINVAENTTAVTTVTANDADGHTPTFSITDGADQGLFNLDAGTGVLTFAVAPDFEGPGDNSYEVEVTADDGNGGTEVQLITVTVTDVNEAPVANADSSHLVFDGDDFIQVADHASLQMTNNLTMEAWINHSGNGTGSQIILNKEGEYELGITSDTGEIKFAIANAPTWNWHDTGFFVTANEWTHVAVTYDAVAGEAKTFINGSLVDTYSQSGAVGDVYPGFGDLFIGGRENATTQRFQGSIDDVRIWGSTRSEVEIQNNYSDNLSGAEPGLAGNWRLDEADGTLVADQSPNGNDGTLGGVEGITSAPTYDGYFTDEDTLLVIPAVDGVLANDFDVDGDTLTVTNLDTTGMLGTLVLNTADGSFSYDPRGAFDSLAVGEIAYENFTYSANDGALDSNIVSVTITVIGANDAPTGTTQVVAAVEETATAIDISGNVADVDGTVVLSTTTVTGGPSNGTLTNNGDGTFSYTGNTDFVGGDSFTYTVEDNDGQVSSDITVTINVSDVNDAPTGTTLVVAAVEETATAIDISGNVADVDGTVVLSTTTVTGGPSNGNLTNNGDGTFSYTGNTDFVGGDSFTYTVEDNDGQVSSDITVTINVSDVNDAPTGTTLVVAAVEETATNIDISGNVADVDGTVVLSTTTVTGGPSNGTLTNNGDGTFSYTGNTDFVGSDSFTYTVEDNDGQVSSDITVTINVSDVNDAPTGTTLVVAAVEETATAIDISANVADVDGTVVLSTTTVTGGPSNGSLTNNGDGTFSYTGDPDFVGSDSFAYTVEDNDGQVSSDITVTINVSDVNDAPTGTTLVVAALEETATTIDISGNVADVDGTVVLATTTVTGGPSNGSLVNNGDGTFSYTGDPDFVGGDSFTYTVEDNDGQVSSDITVTINVSDVNDAPTGTTLVVAAVEETATAIDISANVADVDGTVVLSTTTVTGGPSNGSLINNGDGTFSYTGDTDFVGGDSFTYTVEDNDGQVSSDITVTINVSDVNDAPTGTTLVVAAVEETATAIDISANVADVDGTVVLSTTTVTGGPSNGSLTNNGDGTFSYTGDPDFVGSDSFAYTVEDNDGQVSSDITVTINVSDVNDAPTGTTLVVAALEETATTIDISGNVADVDGTVVLTTTTVTGGPSNGSLVNNGDGTFSYTGNTDFVGGDSFTYTVEDNDGQVSSDITVTINVSDVNDAPTGTTLVVAAVEETATNIDISGNVTDVDGTVVLSTTTVTGGPSNGSLTNNGDGTFSYTGDPNFVGSDSFTYTVEDNDGQVSSDITVTINVSNVNDPAVIAGVDTGSVQEDVAVVANNISTTGTLTIADPDTGESTFQAETVVGSYGSLTIDTAGNWTYAADNTQAAIQQLDVLESITDTITVTAFDGTTHNVVITINGSEDTAVIGGVAVGAVTEDGTLIASDTLSITDVDINDNPISFNDVAPTLGINGYGTFEITANTWNYTLNNGHAAVQALGSSGALNDIFTFVATDGSTRVVTVTINGANDAPVIGGTSTGAVAEDVAVSAGNILDSGSLAIADPDAGESGFIATTINGTYGDLTIDAAGNWSYSADNSQSKIQSLQAGESVSDTLTVTTADGSTHDVVITIIGARDAAPPPAPPPPEPPPDDEPPVDEQIDEIVEEQGGTGDDPILEEIVQVAQDIRTPAPEEDSSFAQPDEPESEPVNYGPAIDKQTAKIPEQPQPQALQAQNLSIDTLTLQVSDDEALNEQYELELLGRIDSMHLGMDDEAAQQNADDVNVQIFVGSTASLTVGIVSWVLRGGALLASFMSTVPLLNRFDPLPILKAREDEEDVEPGDDDDEKTQVREHARKVDNMFSGKGDSQQ